MRGLCRRGVDMIAYYSGFSDEMQGVGWGFWAGALWKTLAGSKEDSVKGTMVPFTFNQPAAATVSGPVEGPKRLFLCKKGQDTQCVSCPLAQRKGFEPLNAFNTLHDFQSCAFDQLSHLCTVSLLNSKNYCSRTLKKSQEKNPNYSRNFPTKRSRPVCRALRGRLVSKKFRFWTRWLFPCGANRVTMGPKSMELPPPEARSGIEVSGAALPERNEEMG